MFRMRLLLAMMAFCCCVDVVWGQTKKTANNEHPNIVLIVCDNLGYGDIEPFGSQLHRTPNLLKLAKQGRKFTSFYVSSGVCTPSRASLMTGCYPRRINMHEDAKGGLVLRPVASRGLHPNEVTIAELLRSMGYATGLIGKWHLGDQPIFLPTRQGFDYYFGIPYSDDMTQRPGQPWPPLPLMQNEKVIEAPVDRNLLTKRYTEEAIRFIRENAKRPFFLCLTHAMPGSTNHPFASEPFRGKSANGAWGDSVEEIDWSTGQLMQTLKNLHIEEKTLLIWTSDNGAPRRNPVQGSNRPLPGWGYTVSEGGMRVPCIVSWPGKVPANTICDEVCTTMDLLPTFCKLAECPLPKKNKIDGKDICPLLFGSDHAKSPHNAFFYYQGPQLQAVRSGKWKLYLPLTKKMSRGKVVDANEPARLYDLDKDLSEQNNVAKQNEKVVRRLLQYAEAIRADIGDLERAGQNQRPAGSVENPVALRKSKK